MNKWQKGIPPKTGWYWILYRSIGSEVSYSKDILFYRNGEWQQGEFTWKVRKTDEWIGPLEEPELPEE